MAKKDVLKGRSIVNKNVFDTANKSTSEIKRANPIVEYFKSRGVDLKSNGNGQFMGLCPFHDDHNPSLSVNEIKQVFKCFGCGKSGTVLDAVSFYENVAIGEAIKILQNKDLKTKETEFPKDEDPAEDLRLDLSDLEELEEDITPTANEADRISLTDIAEHYHKELFNHQEAIEYLHKRGIKNPEIISTYKIGFSDGKSLTDKLSKKQVGFLIERGILRKNRQEAFANCLVFPIFDESDQAVHFYVRNIKDSAKVKHLYLSGSHKSVFNLKAVKAYSDQMILTESIIDAVSLIQLGINNVWSCYGVNGFTDEMLGILKENRVKEIVIAFDNDDAGKNGAEKLKDKLINNGFKVKIITPSNHGSTGSQTKDWNEELQNNITAEAVKKLIENAALFETKLKNDSSDKFRVSVDNGLYVFAFENIIYRMAGIRDIFSPNLKVKLRVESKENYHRDNLDLYSYRARQNFASITAGKLNVNSVKVEKDLDRILDYFEEERDKKTNPSKETEELTEAERALGLRFLKGKNVFQEIIDDVTTIGYVGEDLNKLLLYLCATSRLTDYPVSVLIISQSATGKSYLVDIVKKLIPANEVITIHSLSDQALNYIKDLIGKFLAFGEAIFNPEVERQIREMLSSKELSRMVVDKDDKSGELIGKIISKEVNVACVMSTTSNNVHPENASRFFIINADESFLQTQKIHKKQLDKYSPDRYYEKQDSIPAIIKKHHAAQRLLKKISVVIPDIMRKLIKFPFHSLRTRRDHERFIDLMASICFLRQYQKETKKFKDGKEYVECDSTDYDIAKMIMINGALTSTLSEIPEGAIRLYDALRKMVAEIAETEDLKTEEVTFTQRDVREFTGFGQSWIKQNLRLLVEYEYLNRVRGGSVKGSRSFYRLKADEDMIKIDFSMLPDAEVIKKALENRETEE